MSATSFRAAAVGALAALALAAGALASCAADRTAGAPATAAPAAVPSGAGSAAEARGAATAAASVDEALLAYLATARARHLRADLLEEKGDLAGARAEMEALVALPLGGSAAARDAAQDAWARLARLDVDATPPRLDDAERAVESGLAVSPEETFYRANLLMAKGEILEARGAADAALDAYEQSIAINKKVLERLRTER
ncbi:MAG TPA: hypothetical protein VG389_10460 [Myxococcota bacterium]|jgi:tetratricopeptide (TPR) repeat protein|nr:hypothetical protein [Myxococcota bacterium]